MTEKILKEEHKLSAIFMDVCSSLFEKNSKVCYSKLNIEDYDELEANLQDYLNHVLGYKLDNDYTSYYREIRHYFENILLNATSSDFEAINKFIIEYKDMFSKDISNRPLFAIFLESMKKSYSNDNSGVFIGNVKSAYTVERIARKGEDDLPAIIIKNAEKFENTLKTFVDKVITSDSYFNSFFEGLEFEEAVSYLFEWVIKSATASDLEDVEKYFKKYASFVVDGTLINLKKPVKIGDLLGDEIYVIRKRANVNYETPYYLSFIIKGNSEYIELPTVRLGIEENNEFKKAYILATQTSQDNVYMDKYKETENFIKKLLSKSNKFREYNPAHTLSIILAFGILKGLGIERIVVEDYFPLRRQRLVLENQKNEEELDDLQYRLTNKNINNYFRLLEFFTGIDIVSYPDMGEGVELFLSDNIQSSNPFLQKLYNMGYNAGFKNRVSSEIDEKELYK